MPSIRPGLFDNKSMKGMTISDRCHFDVRASGQHCNGLEKKDFCIIATSSQYHVHGSRARVKIRSSPEGVGSSPDFGTDAHIAISVTALTWIGHSLMEKGRNCARPAAKKPR